MYWYKSKSRDKTELKTSDKSKRKHLEEQAKHDVLSTYITNQGSEKSVHQVAESDVENGETLVASQESSVYEEEDDSGYV